MLHVSVYNRNGIVSMSLVRQTGIPYRMEEPTEDKKLNTETLLESPFVFKIRQSQYGIQIQQK